jgi:hypothetical protein
MFAATSGHDKTCGSWLASEEGGTFNTTVA